MELIIFFTCFVLPLMILVMGLSSYSVLGGTLLSAFGFRDEVFVNRDGSLVYHKTRNFLPTFPKLVSRFPELHTSPLTRDEALARLSDADKAKYRRDGIESILDRI